MRYLLAILLPPVAVLFSVGFGAFLLNLLLCLLLFIPGMIHAILCVNKFYADRRHAELLAALSDDEVPSAPSPLPEVKHSRTELQVMCVFVPPLAALAVGAKGYALACAALCALSLLALVYQIQPGAPLALWLLAFVSALMSLPESKPIESALIPQPSPKPPPKGYDAERDVWKIEA